MHKTQRSIKHSNHSNLFETVNSQLRFFKDLLFTNIGKVIAK